MTRIEDVTKRMAVIQRDVDYLDAAVAIYRNHPGFDRRCAIDDCLGVLHTHLMELIHTAQYLGIDETKNGTKQ
jgi:hypothetical protein